MVAKIVTGYIPIFGHPRSPAEYGELGEKMFAPLAAASVPIQRYLCHVNETWLWKYIDPRKNVTHAEADNPQKNSLAYHCVQHQKFGWLLKAAVEDPRFDTYVWLDYGIGHVPGVTADVVREFLQEVDRRPTDFAIPGCWPTRVHPDDNAPCWRFCGGALVVPRVAVHRLYKAVKRAALTHIDKTGSVWWEVNSLAAAERANQLPKLRWYQADHNETMFTNYAKDAPPCPASK